MLEPRTALSVNILNNYATGLNLAHDTGGEAPDPQGAASPAIPASPGVAASPGTFVTTVYTNDQDPDNSIAIFPDKTTSAHAIQSTLANFWVTAGGLPRADPANPNNGLFYHPAVLWDSAIQRFIVGESDFADAGQTSGVEVEDIAVSKSADPKSLTKSDWNFYQIPNTEINQNNLTNFPGPYDADTANWGYNHDEVVFSYSVQSTTTSPQHKLVVAISQQDLANPNGVSKLTYGTNDVNVDQRLRPAVMHDSQAGDPMWFVRQDDNGTSIDVLKATNLLTTNGAVFTPTSLSVTPYQDAANATPLGTNGAAIDGSVEGGILQAAEVGGKLVAAQAVTNSAGDRTMVRWYEISVDTPSPELTQDGEIDDAATGAGQAGVFDMYPSIDINSNGDIGLSYVQSGKSAGQFLSMYVTGRAAADPSGTMAAPQKVSSGTGSGDPSSAHTSQGTFSGMSLDNDGSFWATNYYVDASGVPNSAVAHFNIGPPTGSTAGVWQPVGPAPISNGQAPGLTSVSGRVTGVAPDPIDPNTLFIATAGGGVWRTVDALDASPKWVPLTDYLSGGGTPLPMFFGAIAETRDNHNNEVVYAGTGFDYAGVGVLVSFDGGGTWSLWNDHGAFLGCRILKIVIDPSDRTGQTVYVAVSTDFLHTQLDSSGNPVPKETGIFKSTNGGQDWTNVTKDAGLSTSDFWSDVVIDPKTGAIYAADGSGGGVYQLFVPAVGPPSYVRITGTDGGGRTSLAIFDDGVHRDLVCAVADPASGGLSKMWKFTLNANGAPNLPGTDLAPKVRSQVGNYLGTGGGAFNVVAIGWSALTDNLYIYAAGTQSAQGLDAGPTHGSPVESDDGGMTWNDISGDFSSGPHSDALAAAFDAQGNLIEGNDGGAFKLNDPTLPFQLQSWQSLNSNLQITQFYSVAVDPKNNSGLGGSQDNGVNTYTGTATWNHVLGGDGGAVQVWDDPASRDQYAYLEYQGGTNLYAMKNGGSLQALINTASGGNFVAGQNYDTDTSGNPIANFEAPFRVASNGDIYYGTDVLNVLHFDVSTGLGTTNWNVVGQPGQFGFNPGKEPITSIALTSDSHVVYVKTTNHIYVSQQSTGGTDGFIWTDITPPFNVSQITPLNLNALAADPSNPNIAYVVVSTNTSSSAGHIWEVTVSGTSSTWNDISNNIPPGPVDCVAVSPDGKTIYVGTDAGVYSSTSGGQTWATVGSGLPNVLVTEIDLVNPNLIAVGTFGRGMWELSNASTLGPTIVSTNNHTMIAGSSKAMPFQFVAQAQPGYTFALAGQLPNGVSFDPSTGLLSGIPAKGTAGTYPLTITATNTSNSSLTDSMAFTLTVAEPNNLYVDAVYNDVLARLPDSGGLAYWTQLLDSNTPASAVAQLIAHSAEYYANFVIVPAYLKLLGRAADNAGVAFWTQQMQNGLTDQQLQAGFVASPEFYANAGGTNTGWIDSIYKLLLGRPADPGGEQFWDAQLAAGATLLDVALRIAGSAENDAQLINADYLHYLGRPSDPGGLDFWLSQFATGQTNEDVIAGFTGSAEYYDEHTT
jgi:hypothetical protein